MYSARSKASTTRVTSTTKTVNAAFSKSTKCTEYDYVIKIKHVNSCSCFRRVVKFDSK